MKKTLLFAGALALVLSFSSCKKDYTCECTYTGGHTSELIRDTETKAQDKCDDLASTMSASGINAVCKLK